MKKTYLLLSLIFIFALIFRVVSLDKFPAGLNADEAAIGYNAWSLLETGKDEHSVSWPSVFRSFDDYKPPLYFYMVLPFVKFFGLNIWSVRLPSAILGALTVLLVFFFVRSLSVLKKESANTSLALISSLVLATNPWHIHFSRGGWEVNASCFFILLALFALQKSFKNVRYLYLFGISSIIALYTYHSARLILPLIAVGIVAIHFTEFKSFFAKINLRHTLAAIAISVILVVPLGLQMISKEGQSRFTGVSVFSDEGPLWQALELRRAHPKETILVKLIHNRYLSYGLRFTKNYLSHFSPRFLFVTGDEIARSKVPGVGQSLLLLSPFFFIGLFELLKLDTSGKKAVFVWFILAPVAAAMTFQSPHALRAQNMTIPLSIIIGAGLLSTLSILKSKLPALISFVCIGALSAILLYDFANYTHAYLIHYPQELPYAWQYGFDQIAEYSKTNYEKYDRIIVSDRYDQPYILMAFFLKYPPQTLQKELVMTPRDKFGFSTVRKFGKFEFRKINYSEDIKLQNTLIISADEGVDDKKVIDTIFDPAGKPMYKMIATPKANDETKK